MSPGGIMSTIITCLQCGGSLGPGDRFCAQCGAELLWCASCGEFLLQAEQSCPKCGTPGIPRPESHTIPYELTEADSPWAEVVARLRRATLGEFEIGHELGRGGMAAVFLAHELSLHRDVAIKVMSPGLLMGDGMIERFRREAITIAHLNHPNIVSVFSVRAAEGLHFFVMRCVQGRSLEQVIKQAGKLPIPIVRSILYQVGSALAYAHRFKVVHRDIKPANILVDEEGNAVVTDFGIAKATEGPSHTHTGFMVGTPAYMSPEQCSGGEVSGASDQYSLGAVAYEMITGMPPFSGSTYSVIQAHVERPPRPIREHSEDCPSDLEEAILKMLAKEPNDRWLGMTQALTALSAAPLMDDDPLRAELSRLATAGRENGYHGLPTPISQPPRTNAVLHVTPPGMMRAITILPPPPALEVGDSFLLVARVHEGNAAHLPSRPVEWSSDTPGILRVNATKAVATAIAPGSALITATCDGNQGRLRVTVAPPRADSILVKPPDRPISVGDEVQLEAVPRDKRGRVVPRPVTWRSENDSVVTVSLDGQLVARSGGTTKISAELDEARAKVSVTVLPAPVAALHVSPPPEVVTAGDSFALSATPLDRWAGPLSDRTVNWNTSDVRVAVVTAGGWVMTRSPGLVMLTATCEGVSASVSFNVVAKEAAALPSAVVPGHSSSGPWNLDEPVEIARSERSRPRWAVMAGSAFLVIAALWLVGGRRIMTPNAPAESAAAAADSAVTTAAAKDPPAAAATDSDAPSSVTITQRPARPLAAGSSTKLVAEVRDQRGRLIQDANVGWISTDTAVVSVDSTDGTLQAVGPGRAEVVAAAGGSRDSARIIVRTPSGKETRAGLMTASLSVPPHQPIKVGESATLAATALDSRGKPIRAARINWSSSEPQVADVDAATGKVRAYSPGTALIIAQSGSESAISPISVLPAEVASIQVAGARPLKVGDTLTLRAEPQDRRGSQLSDRPVEWTTSDDAVAGVDPASGAVDARAPGSVDITATSEGKSGHVRLTVLPEPRTSRQEQREDSAAAPSATPPPEDLAVERQRLIDQMKAGVEQCYGALRQKDVNRLALLYQSVTKSDREKLKRLSRILQTGEWEAEVGSREDGAQRIDAATAAMDFSFRLTWKDAFGGRLSSKPVFRAEFAHKGDSWDMSSCRIVGSPKL
jgi:eukaryotic-like serine/threonine-protein kinase